MQMIFKAENLLVDVLSDIEIGGVKRFRIRDAKNKKADVRTVLEHALRPATEEDIEHVVYLYTDDETGEVHSLKLQKVFIAAVTKFIGVGSASSKSAAELLGLMGKADTDSHRRQFRAAVAYWLERGLLIVSSTTGYFVAESSVEVESCVKNKERQARANIKRAEFLRSMDVAKSVVLFQTLNAAV